MPFYFKNPAPYATEHLTSFSDQGSDVDKIVVTGGAGFIGSHICDHLVATYPQAHLTIIDNLTYAGNIKNLSHITPKAAVKFIKGDVCDLPLMQEAIAGADWVIHAAAESHVERSFEDPLVFSRTNILGTHTVMEACRLNEIKHICHLSTDEVYGEIVAGHFATEDAPLLPTTPYSSTKAAADLIIESYRISYALPVTILRPCNIYGTRQYPEKIIPRFCSLAARKKPMPIQGAGNNSRFYMSVNDLCRAILFIQQNNIPAGIYNVSSDYECTNLAVARMIAAAFNLNPDNAVEFVKDRVYHDSRYAMNSAKLRKYGWSPQDSLPLDINELAQWYGRDA